MQWGFLGLATIYDVFNVGGPANIDREHCAHFGPATGCDNSLRRYEGGGHVASTCTQVSDESNSALLRSGELVSFGFQKQTWLRPVGLIIFFITFAVGVLCLSVLNVRTRLLVLVVSQQPQKVGHVSVASVSIIQGQRVNNQGCLRVGWLGIMSSVAH